MENSTSGRSDRRHDEGKFMGNILGGKRGLYTPPFPTLPPTLANAGSALHDVISLKVKVI